MPSIISVRRNVLYRVPAVAVTGEQTVLFDASSLSAFPSEAPTNGVLTQGFSGIINVGSGANGTSNVCLIAALFLIGQNAGTSTPTALNWDSGGTPQAMTLIPSANTGNSDAGEVYFYYLMNPTLGSKNFTATWSGSNQALLSAVSFVNVDQTGGTTTFPTVVTNTGTAASAGVSIATTPTARKLIGAFTAAGSGFSVSGASGTDLGHNNSGVLASGAANYDAGTAAALSYALTSSRFAAVGVAIKGH